MPNRLRIGIVGFGKMGQEHARMIAESTEMAVVLVVEPNGNNSEMAGEILGDAKVQLFADLGEPALSIPVDGWIVATSTDSHIATARLLLERGHRVLLEKPISESQESALQLHDFVRADSSNLMMGHIVLWSPEFQELQKKVRLKSPIREIQTLRQRSQSHRTDYPKDSIISLLLVHDLYCIQVFTGGEEPVALKADVSSHLDGGVDSARVQLSWAGLTTATSEANYFLPNFPAGLVDDQITLNGDDWSECAIFQGDFDQALRNELAHFAALLRNEVSVPVGARYRDAVQVQGWLDTLISVAIPSERN